MVYNGSSSREPSEFEKQVGIGVCSIIIVLLNSDNSPIEWKDPCLPLKNQAFQVLVEIWFHESLNLEFLTREMRSVINQAEFDLSLSIEIGKLYERCQSEDISLNHATFSSIDNLLILNQSHKDIYHYQYHFNIETYISTISDILFDEISKLCDGLIFLKKYQKSDRGNEIKTLIVGFYIPIKHLNSSIHSSTNDLLLLSLSNANNRSYENRSSTLASLSLDELFNLEFFIISVEKAAHMSTYRASSDFAHVLNHLIFRWTTNYDLKNQKVTPILFQGTSLSADQSHLAAIDVFESLLYSQKDARSIVFEQEIHLQQWTAFPLINDQLRDIENDFRSKRYEWNLRYQKEILHTFGNMLKAYGYRQIQNMISEPFKIDQSKVSSFERYFYLVDGAGVLHVIQSHIRGNYFYISHFLISKRILNREEDLLRRLVVGLFEKHVKLTTELIESKETGFPCLLEKLKILHQTFPKAPPGSRMFLVKGFYTPTDPNVSSSLFQYIFLNPQRYGFCPLLDYIGCYIRTKTPDFRTVSNSIDGEEFDYILVLYSNRQQTVDAKPIFKYYIVVLNLTPLAIDDDISTSEYIGGGYYLGDIVRNAEKRISALLTTSLKYYSRDSLWRQLHESQEVRCRESSEWITLFLEKISLNSRSFLAVDPNLDVLFSNTLIDWNKVLDHLCQVFKGHLLVQDSSTHFILYNDSNSDYLVHLSILNNCCSACIVSREGVSDPIEWEAIDGVVNEILLFLVYKDV